jgi:Ca-activated chloride channel family protein
MLDHLRPDDRFGMILFNHEAHLAKPVSLIDATDIAALKGHIMALSPTGATNMEEGLEEGCKMLMPFTLNNPDEFENRIIFLTDAMPNTDDTSESGLLAITENMARHHIHMTFVGMGVDFNSQLIKSISKVKGANYYSVHSPGEFKKRLADEFECMVTPMIFDLTLALKAPGFRISQVIGSPEADAATGRIMHVKTLFPAPTDENGTRGGIILLRLEKLSDNPEITLSVNYEDRSGREDEVNSRFSFATAEPEHFDDAGIRKGVLLARYADLVRNSATASHKRVGPANEGKIDGSGWSYWERSASPLTVSLPKKTEIDRFCEHLKIEISAIGDKSLEQEVLVLSRLSQLVEKMVVAQ